VVIGQSGTGVPATLEGLSQAGGDAAGTDRVLVYTWNTSLAATDKPFHLTVLC
jgi:hypothetical protein